MKYKILTIILSFLLAGNIFAQSNTISYTFMVEGCGEDEDLVLFSGTMLEGDNLIFEDYTFPNVNSDAQFFYNLMVGGELGFPEGSLNENIHCDIMLAGLCDLDLTNLTNEEDLLKLLYLKISVTGENSGVHDENDYYYLENGKESYLRLPLGKLLGFLNYISYSIEDFTPFFVGQQSEPDFNGIRKVVGDEFLSIYSKHFSTIGVGFKVDDPTNVNTLNVTPNEYGLAQNYPNPFNPSTQIVVSIPESGMYTLRVYNILGQEVAVLLDDNITAGVHTFYFDASHLTSGIYFYNFTGLNFTQTKKMMLVK